MKRALTLIGTLGLGALLSAACGGDDDGAATDSTGAAAAAGMSGAAAAGNTFGGTDAGGLGSGGTSSSGSGGATSSGGATTTPVTDSGANTGSGGGTGTTTPAAPPAEGVLSQCTTDADCGGDLVCYSSSIGGVGGGFPGGGGMTTTSDGFCTEACTPGDVCPDLGGVAATCSSSGECRVDCAGSGSGDGPCPPLMECVEVPIGTSSVYRCEYPADVGSGGNADGGSGGGGADTAITGELAPCSSDGDCDGDLVCYGAFLAGSGTSGFCTRSCTGDSDCFDHQGVDFTCGSVGTQTGGQGCRVDCSATGTDGSCPTDMVCATGFAERCMLVAI